MISVDWKFSELIVCTIIEPRAKLIVTFNVVWFA